jgi:hypothetical protein
MASNPDNSSNAGQPTKSWYGGTEAPAPLDGLTNVAGWNFLTGTVPNPLSFQTYEASQSDFYGCGPMANSVSGPKIVTT